MIDIRYREHLVNQIILAYLLTNKIPSAYEVGTALQAKLQEYPDQSRPWLSTVEAEVRVQEHEPSSASRFNRLCNTAGQDLAVLQEECLALQSQQGHLFDRNLREIRMLRSWINRLEHQLNSNLLVHRETAGYGHCLADNFADASLVDLVKTTAALNLEQHCATLGVGESGFVNYPTTHLQADDLQVTVVTRTGLVHTGLNQQDLLKAFSPTEEAWRLQVLYERGDQDVTVELKVKVSPTPITLNRITFRNYGVSSYKTKLEVFASLDDYNWNQIGTERYLHDEVDLRFHDASVKWLKFRFTKEHYDYQRGLHFVYEFGARSFQFSRLTYHSEEAVLMSKPLSLSDAQGRPMVFSQVSLEVCEDLPAGTDIQYFLSFDDGQSFSAIAPLGRPQQDTPSLIQLDQLQEVQTQDFGLDLTTAYHYQHPHHILLSHVLPDNLVPGSLKLWRNLGTKGRLTTVRQGLSGWGIDGQYYVCAIQVTNPDGLVLNLGPTTMEINRVPRTGSILLPPGTYTIRSNRAFWSHLYNQSGRIVTYFKLATELGDGTFRGQRADGYRITVRDPLYPYNHKLLIEGIDYDPAAGAVRNLTYPGVDLFAETLMRQTSEVELTHNPDCANLQHFALTQVATASGPEWRILVQYSPLTGNSGDRFDQEVFRAYYQQPVELLADSVIFKAVLRRNPDVTASPSLYYYIVKLSN